MAEPCWTRYHTTGPDQSIGVFGVCQAPRPPGLSDLIVNNDLGEELVCPICLEILAKPHAVIPCGHVFCIRCITRNREHNNNQNCTCPVCYVALDRDSVPARVVANLIGKMEMRCRNSLSYNTRTEGYEALDKVDQLCWGEVALRKGCTEVFRVSEQAGHEARCGFAVRPCTWEGCEFTGLSAEVGRHEALCDFRRDRCWHCNTLVCSRRLELHIYWCPERVIPCSNSKFGCPEKLKRKDTKHHVKHECKWEAVRPVLEKQELRIKQLEKEVERLRKRAHDSDRSSPVEPVAKHPCHSSGGSNQVAHCQLPQTPPRETSAVAQDTMFGAEDKLSQVFIKCPSKKLLCVGVFLKSDTAACLFDRIEQAWNITPQQCQLRISFRSKVLVATETLASQGVERDLTLQVVPVMNS